MEERMLEMAMRLGKVDEGDREVLELLCAQAAEELTLRLRKGVTPEQCGDAFPLAGAWLALAGLSAAGDGVERFTAGDLTIQHREGGARETAYRLQAEQVIRPYVRDDGFVFRGVRG